MTANMGGVDRAVRIVLGLALIAVFAVTGSLLGLLGLIPLATAIAGWCPAYTVFGFSTCRTRAP